MLSDARWEVMTTEGSNSPQILSNWSDKVHERANY